MAALAATAYGGVRAGLVSSVVGVLLIQVFVIQPRFHPSVAPEQLVGLAVTLLGTLIAGAIYERARAGQQRAQSLAANLEDVAAALRVSETRWRQVAEAMPAMIAEATAGGAIVYFNSRWSEYTGLSADELLGRWPDVVHPDDQARVMREREAAIAAGEAYSHQWRARGRDGAYRWLAAFSSPVRDDAGRIVSWIGTSVDIEDMKRGEQILRNQANLLDETHDAVLVWDFDEGGISYWNKGAQTLYGYAPHEASGRRPQDLLLSIYEQPFEIVEHILASTGRWDGIIDQTASDGRRVKIESRRVLVPEADGRRVVLEVNRDVTARVRADEAIRASEARWRGVTEAMPALIFEMTRDGRMTHFNERAVEFTGLPLENLLGDGWLEAIHPDDLPQWKLDWEAARASGTPIVHEHRLRCHDGTYRWHLAHGTPLRDADGVITSWLGIKVDIDDRRRAEEELKASQEQFRSLVGAVPANVFLHTPDGAPLFANDRWLTYVGLSFDEAMEPGRFYDLVHEEDRATLRETWTSAAASSVATRMEYRMRRNDGAYRWHLSDGLPLHGEDGAVTMWLTVSIDIDEQKRAHDEIAASEVRMRESVARYEALISAAPSFVFLADARGSITWNSPGYYEYLGLEPGEADAWRWLPQEIVHRDDLPEQQARWQMAIASGDDIEVEVRLRGADDVYRWYLQRASATRDETGAITGWVGTSTDIDERKRAADALHASEQRLRSIVETAVDGIITVDENGLIESWNPAAANIFGHDSDAAIGEHVRLLLPISEGRHSDDVTEVLRTGETSGRRKDGTTFPMELAVSETSIEGRRLFTALVRDVTERRLADDALRASEERFRLAAAASRIGAWEWDLGTTVSWSDSMEEIYGFEPGGYSGTFEAFMAHVHPDDRDPTMRAINQALASGEELDFEHRIALPDGSIRWLNGRGRLIRDESGKPIRMAGIGMDVTERKHAQSELALAEERLRLATEGADFGTWDWHREDDRVYCSERELALFGVSADERLTSQGLMDRVHPDDRAGVAAQLADAVERRATSELEFRVVHPNGSVRWLAGWAVSIADAHGTPSRLIGLNADITARKREERDQQFLADLGTALQQSLDHDVLVKEIVACTVKGFAQFCALYLREGELVRRVAAGAERPDDVNVTVFPAGTRESYPVARALAKGRETLVADVSDDMLRDASATPNQLADFRQIRLSSSIVVPLRSAGRVIGALSLAASKDHPPFDETDFETAREIAHRVTLALENARLYEQAERDAARAKTMGDLSALLVDSAGQESVLQQAAATVVGSLADACFVDLLTQGGSPRRVASAADDAVDDELRRKMQDRWTGRGRPPGSAHGFWYAVEEGKPELVEHITAEMVADSVADPELRDTIGALGVRSSLCIPLIARGRTLGAMTFLMMHSGRNFTADELPYFEEIGRRVAQAIDNAQLYRAEREAQEALSERLAELEVLLDTVPVGIAIAHDPACERITANAEYERMLRTPQPGVNISKSAADAPAWFRVLRDGEPVADEDLPIQRAASTGQPVFGDVLDLEFTDGSPAVREIGSALPLFGADGSVRGALGVFMDITDRLRVEDDLRRALATKDDFLGMVSHELKTPITMVRGNAEILLRRGDALDEETRRQSVQDILLDSERLQSIIENLLLLARLDHAQDLPLEPLYVARAIERVVTDYTRRASGREVRFDDRSGGAVAVAEVTYIEQIMRNLFSNAVKYSPLGAPIDVIVESTDSDVIVRVIDQGPGIAPEEAESIFTPFYRSVRTASQAHGVGVGLAVCRRMVEALGGRMWCVSHEGSGEFVFTLPRADDQLDV